MQNKIYRALTVLRHEGPGSFGRKVWAKITAYRSQMKPGSFVDEQEYQNWISVNEPDPDELNQQRREAATFSYRPLISVIVPVYNTPVSILQKTVQSVVDQTYDHWELCIADGGSTSPDLAVLLNRLSQDSRIRVQRLEKNLGISENTNTAIRLARGDFLAFLDHDDLLAPFALYEVVKMLNADPAVDLLYSDHDLISADGKQRQQPLFKPDWSPHIMLSSNYITHLTVVRRSLVDEVGGFDPEMDGAQDWDLFFKISERTQRIGHIPKILYHWRSGSDSTADNIWKKEYAPAAQLRAIKAHLERKGLTGVRAFFDPKSGFIRVGWDVPEPPKVSIIIPSKGANALLETCVKSIQARTEYPDYEIVIVNNGPQPPEDFEFYRQVTRNQRVRVVHFSGPFNYNSVNNFGARAAQGELFLFLNNDTEVVEPDWLSEMVLFASLEDVGVVGARLLTDDNKIQHSGVIIGLTGFAGHIFAGMPENQWTIFGVTEWYRNFQAVTGACLMIRKGLFNRLGGFDENFTLCGSDVELCLRVRKAGYQVVVNPFAKLKHKEGATRGTDVPAQDYFLSYPHYLPSLQQGDPYFNPNLSYWHPNPRVSKPGEQRAHEFVVSFLEKLR